MLETFPAARTYRLLVLKRRLLACAWGAGLAVGPALARPVVTLVPAVQFIREGGQARLKARVTGSGTVAAWTWQILDGSPGVLDSIDFGRVSFLAEGVAPWTSIRIRAASTGDPSLGGEAVVEVLPDAVFQTLEEVMGQGWIERESNLPSPIRLRIRPPCFYSPSDIYVFHAEIDRAEADRFRWEISPALGRLRPGGGRARSGEEVEYLPPDVRQEPVRITVRVTNRENGAFTQEATLDLPRRVLVRFGRWQMYCP